MNGCLYLYLTRPAPDPGEGRQRRGARRQAMCLANSDPAPCEQYAHMRGERCYLYRAQKQEQNT